MCWLQAAQRFGNTSIGAAAKAVLIVYCPGLLLVPVALIAACLLQWIFGWHLFDPVRVGVLLRPESGTEANLGALRDSWQARPDFLYLIVVLPSALGRVMMAHVRPSR